MCREQSWRDVTRELTSEQGLEKYLFRQEEGRSFWTQGQPVQKQSLEGACGGHLVGGAQEGLEVRGGWEKLALQGEHVEGDQKGPRTHQRTTVLRKRPGRLYD